MVGTQIKNLDKHLTQVFSIWEGLSVTLRHFTETLDERGQLVSSSSSDTTILGVISALPKKSELRGAGWINETNQIGFFQTTSILEHDHIIWGSDTYEVIKIHGLLYDINTAIAQTVELAKVSV